MTKGEHKMKKYDVSYFGESEHKVIRLYASRSEEEIRRWLEAHMGAKNIRLSEADTSDVWAGVAIVRI